MSDDLEQALDRVNPILDGRLVDVIGIDKNQLHQALNLARKAGVSESHISTWLDRLSVYSCPRCEIRWYMESPECPKSTYKIYDWRFYGFRRGRRYSSMNYRDIDNKIPVWHELATSYKPHGYCGTCFFDTIAPSLVEGISQLTRPEWTTLCKSIYRKLHDGKEGGSYEFKQSEPFWIAMMPVITRHLPPKYKVAVKYYTKAMAQLGMA